MWRSSPQPDETYSAKTTSFWSLLPNRCHCSTLISWIMPCARQAMLPVSLCLSYTASCRRPSTWRETCRSRTLGSFGAWASTKDQSWRTSDSRMEMWFSTPHSTKCWWNTWCALRIDCSLMVVWWLWMCALDGRWLLPPGRAWNAFAHPVGNCWTLFADWGVELRSIAGTTIWRTAGNHFRGLFGLVTGQKKAVLNGCPGSQNFDVYSEAVKSWLPKKMVLEPIIIHSDSVLIVHRTGSMQGWNSWVNLACTTIITRYLGMWSCLMPLPSLMDWPVHCHEPE